MVVCTSVRRALTVIRCQQSSASVPPFASCIQLGACSKLAAIYWSTACHSSPSLKHCTLAAYRVSRLCLRARRCLPAAFILGIGLATGAADTHTGAHSQGRRTREYSTPGRPCPLGVLFWAPYTTDIDEDCSMNHSTYYRYQSLAWRFSHCRSGQPAASDRSSTGGTQTPTRNRTSR